MNDHGLTPDELQRYKEFFRLKAQGPQIVKNLPFRGVNFAGASKHNLAMYYATRAMFSRATQHGPAITDDDMLQLKALFGQRPVKGESS